MELEADGVHGATGPGEQRMSIKDKDGGEGTTGDREMRLGRSWGMRACLHKAQYLEYVPMRRWRYSGTIGSAGTWPGRGEPRAKAAGTKGWMRQSDINMPLRD